MGLQELVQQAINGLSLGSTYALLALGLAMVFSIMGLINFAHGDLLVVGGYTIWVLREWVVPWVLVIPLTLAATTFAAVAMERIAFRPLRGADQTTLLLTSFAVSFFLENAFGIGISVRPQGIVMPDWTVNVINVGEFSVPLLQIATAAITFACLAALGIFLKRSLLGISMRAAAEDFSITRLMGVSADRVIVAAFAISGLLAGVATLLHIARAASVDPTAGLNPMIKAFIAVIIGGLGNLSGAVAGGFLLGFIEVILQAILPQSALPFRDAFALVLLIAILLARPQGLLGKKQAAS